MKKIALLLLSITLIFSSCKKDEPEVTTPEETIPSAFTKRVLLEDYTKHCSLCIPLNSKIDSMRNHYPNRTLIPVLISGYHSAQIPYFDSINTVLSIPYFPLGSVNRVPATNSGTQTGNIVYKKEYWASNIDLEMQKTTNFGVKINTTLSGNNLNISVKVGSKVTTSDKKLSVFVIEDDALYRTVRQVLTYFKGDGLTLSANEISEKSYNNIDLSGLNLSKTSVVAYIHSFNETTQNFEVENVNEATAGSTIDW